MPISELAVLQYTTRNDTGYDHEFRSEDKAILLQRLKIYEAELKLTNDREQRAHDLEVMSMTTEQLQSEQAAQERQEQRKERMRRLEIENLEANRMHEQQIANINERKFTAACEVLSTPLSVHKKKGLFGCIGASTYTKYRETDEIAAELRRVLNLEQDDEQAGGDGDAQASDASFDVVENDRVQLIVED